LDITLKKEDQLYRMNEVDIVKLNINYTLLVIIPHNVYLIIREKGRKEKKKNKYNTLCTYNMH